MSWPRITVAPNGARRQRSDHATLPITVLDIAQTARRCQVAGADTIHLHIRDDAGQHSLDVGRYRAAIDAVTQSAPAMGIQVTTEAAGVYQVADQLYLLGQLAPRAASIAVREIARDTALAPLIYQTAMQHNTTVQHILYGPDCLTLLLRWMRSGIVPPTMVDAIYVAGQYAPARDGRPDALAPFIEKAHDAGLQMAVCAFGRDEQACLIAAAQLGCDLRVGFENNVIAPDGTVWRDNAAAVASLRHALGALPMDYCA